MDFRIAERTEIGSPMVVTLPMTIQVYPGYKRWRVTVPARDRLLKDCQAVVDQPRALDRERFSEGPLTTLTEEELGSVERAFMGICGLARYAVSSG